MESGRVGRRVIEADFTCGTIGSDGGALLLRQVDGKSGLNRAAAEALQDQRDPSRTTHSLETMAAQHLYGLCCGSVNKCHREQSIHIP